MLETRRAALTRSINLKRDLPVPASLHAQHVELQDPITGRRTFLNLECFFF